MRPTRLAAVLVLAGAAIAGGEAGAGDPATVELTGYVHRFDPGYAIGGETDPAGWVLSPEARNHAITLERIAYLTRSGDADGFARYAGCRVTVRGRLAKDALRAGGAETPARSFDVLDVDWLAQDTFRRASRSPLANAIRRDLALRGVDPTRDGTPDPKGELSPDGTCPDGTTAKRLALVVPPRDSADMYTDVAYWCRSQHVYWVHRTGGFMATDLWAGPYVLPRGLKGDGPRPR